MRETKWVLVIKAKLFGLLFYFQLSSRKDGLEGTVRENMTTMVLSLNLLQLIRLFKYSFGRISRGLYTVRNFISNNWQMKVLQSMRKP